jgi:hypothetical protein
MQKLLKSPASISDFSNTWDAARKTKRQEGILNVEVKNKNCTRSRGYWMIKVNQFQTMKGSPTH